MTGVLVAQCAGCGRLAFPAPLVCHRCGADSWQTSRIDTGVAEEVANVLHAVGGTSEAVTVGSVRLDDGPLVVARVLGDIEPGQPVRVARTEGGICASPIGETREQGASATCPS
jgi:uncharacterized OB-fold protein